MFHRGVLVSFVFFHVVAGISRPTAITIDNNSYKGLLVAIHPSVTESSQLVSDIKSMFTEGSAYLHEATEKRAYFSDVTILVPNTWSPNAAWPPTTSELFNNADIIVQNPMTITRSGAGSAWQSGAHTRSYGGCGQAGVRINIFTDIFGIRGKYTYGPSGRVLVHEWAHFRWGVFDEYSPEGEPQFYFSPTTGKLEAVRCNINLKGRIYKKDPVTHHATICTQVNALTGIYDDGCIFSPYTLGNTNRNVTASIMDRQKVPNVKTFCNDNRADPTRVHNYESPSRHNRLCGSRSTWAVISDSPDFKGGNNPPRDVLDTTPTFKVVRLTNARRMLIALDTSSSMEQHGKLRRARQAATSFIEDGLDDATSVGVVSFDSKARTVAPIAKLTSEKDKKNVTHSLPERGEGETSVGAALLKAVELLDNNDKNASDVVLVILTDGTETAEPKIEDVMHAVKKAGIVVFVIMFSNSEDKKLEKLTKATGGRFYFDQNEDMSTTAVDAMMDVYSLFDTGNNDRPVQIVSEATKLPQSHSRIGSFVLEPNLGKDTRFIFTYTDNVPELVLVSPSGRTYSSIYPEYSEDPVLKRGKITIPKDAETGSWKFRVTNKDSPNERVSIMALSSLKNTSKPGLTFTGAILVEDQGWPIRSQIVAEVLDGTVPVKNLKVKATVDRPQADPVELHLYDQGAGADTIKDDGIYSRFFTRFTTSGRYNVKIEMIDEGGDILVTGAVGPNDLSHISKVYAGSMHIEHPRLPSHILEVEKQVDEYPPMRITDLRVIHTKVTAGEGAVFLAWTAPGDDEDFDTAKNYIIVQSSDVEELLSGGILPAVPATNVITGNLDNPQPFGCREQFQVKVSIPSDTNVSVVFAVFAMDEVGNKGDLSNPVTVGFGYVDDVTTPEYLMEKTVQADDTQSAPDSQKVMISSVVGSMAGLLLLVLFITIVIYFVQKLKKNKNDIWDLNTKNGIV